MCADRLIAIYVAMNMFVIPAFRHSLTEILGALCNLCLHKVGSVYTSAASSQGADCLGGFIANVHVPKLAAFGFRLG